MSKLGGIAAQPGMLALGEYTRDGKLVDFRSEHGVPKELGAMASQFAASIEMLMGTYGASLSEISRLPMVPFHGWLFTGGDRTSIIQDGVWEIFETSTSQYRAPDDADALGLEALGALPGVEFAAYYAPDGTEIAHRQTLDLDRSLHRSVTEIVASASSTFRGLSKAFALLTKAPWEPLRGWIYSGGDWTVAANPSCWVLAEAGESNISELHRALIR